jgi:hypothetical protein
VLVLVGVAATQSARRNFTCPDGPAGAACRSFKDAVEDEDKHIVEAEKRDHVIACFRPNEDVFLLLSYDSPRRGLWHARESGSGFEQAGSVDFMRFRNGNANIGGESLFAVGQWVSPSTDEGKGRFSGTSLLPAEAGTSGAIHIDPSGAQISHIFRDKWNDPMMHYEFSMKTSTEEFVETFATTSTSSTEGHELKKVSGQCVVYK